MERQLKLGPLKPHNKFPGFLVHLYLILDKLHTPLNEIKGIYKAFFQPMVKLKKAMSSELILNSLIHQFHRSPIRQFISSTIPRPQILSLRSYRHEFFVLPGHRYYWWLHTSAHPALWPHP